ncbi:MAG: RpoL/Rpb11 RNA polymerase subunit family protein [Candidatus Bathyarchaeia archaeon]
MKLNAVNFTDKELKVRIEGEGHTLLNVLQKILLRNSAVEVAGYDVPHPLVDASVFYVKTKEGEKVTSAVVESAKELKSEAEAFRKAFEKALKEYLKKHA